MNLQILLKMAPGHTPVPHQIGAIGSCSESCLGALRRCGKSALFSASSSHPSRNLCPARLPSPSYAAYLYISLSVG